MFENGLRAGRDIGSILRSHLKTHPDSALAKRIEDSLSYEGLESLAKLEGLDALESIL
jgi:hypothetical protein